MSLDGTTLDGLRAEEVECLAEPLRENHGSRQRTPISTLPSFASSTGHWLRERLARGQGH